MLKSWARADEIQEVKITTDRMNFIGAPLSNSANHFTSGFERD